jgi:hypothetical protein
MYFFKAQNISATNPYFQGHYISPGLLGKYPQERAFFIEFSVLQLVYDVVFTTPYKLDKLFKTG